MPVHGLSYRGSILSISRSRYRCNFPNTCKFVMLLQSAALDCSAQRLQVYSVLFGALTTFTNPRCTHAKYSTGSCSLKSHPTIHITCMVRVILPEPVASPTLTFISSCKSACLAPAPCRITSLETSPCRDSHNGGMGQLDGLARLLNSHHKWPKRKIQL